MNFSDRVDAGKKLAQAVARIQSLPRERVVVVALPRGGVPVAFEVAHRLHAPLDILAVRKLGVPGHEELAMGAITADGTRIMNDGVIHALGVSTYNIEKVIAKEQQELARRERLYREGRRPTPVNGMSVVLVDDGIATGATLRAAIRTLRGQGAAHIVIAVPVAPRDTLDELRPTVDAIVCLHTRDDFIAVGEEYEDFAQVSDTTVRQLLTTPTDEISAAALQSSDIRATHRPI